VGDDTAATVLKVAVAVTCGSDVVTAVGASVTGVLVALTGATVGATGVALGAAVACVVGPAVAATGVAVLAVAGAVAAGFCVLTGVDEQPASTHATTQPSRRGWSQRNNNLSMFASVPPRYR
jgi:hypothetical protein